MFSILLLRFRPVRVGTQRRLAKGPMGTCELLEGRNLLASDLGVTPACIVAQRTASPTDVNGDEFVTALDALLIVNQLSPDSSCVALAGGTGADASHVVAAAQVDVNGDGWVSARDALLVLNDLTRPQTLAAAAADADGGVLSIALGSGTELGYRPDSGEVFLTAGETPIVTLEILSASGIFTGEPALNLGGSFDLDTDTKIFKLDIDGFGFIDLGPVAQTGLTLEFLQQDLTISGAPVGGGYLGNYSASFYLRTALADSTNTSSIPEGRDFDVRVWVDDVHARPFGDQEAGVASAHVNLNYDPEQLRLVDVTFPPGVDADMGADTSVLGVVGNLGGTMTAISNSTLLATVRFEVIRPGTTTLTMSESDWGVMLQTSDQPLTFDQLRFAPVTLQLEGGTHPIDVVNLAKALTDAGVVMYGAAWCPHCTRQKSLFEDGQYYLDFVEVTNPDRTPNAIGIEKSITTYPTWVFPDGSRLEGEQTLETLQAKLGAAVPYSTTPTTLPLQDVTLLSGSPLHLPIDAYSIEHDELTFEIESSNPNVSPELIAGRSLQLNVAGYGPLLFKLFENEVPRVVDQIVSLAGSGFYDGVTFHRVISDFVIQGGDPTGTGTGGSMLGQFDDQFDLDLQHNRSGVLSMAKSTDDTNDSQFFITASPQRHLDFNHSVFGQLVEGDAARAAIDRVPTQNSKPTIPVTIESVVVFDDHENALLRLSAPEGYTGEADIQVTVRNVLGESVVRTFHVTVMPDTSNGAPFLDEIEPATVTEGIPFTSSIHATDAEGDEVVYSASILGAQGTIEIDSATGDYTLTPAPSLSGVVSVRFRVEQATATSTADKSDTQVVDFQVEELALDPPELPQLVSVPNTQLLRDVFITNNPQLQMTAAGLAAPTALGEWIVSGVELTGVTSSDGTVTSLSYELLVDGQYTITVRQHLVGGEASESSLPVFVLLDRVVPRELAVDLPTELRLGASLNLDLNHEEEAAGAVRYRLLEAPAGMVIDSMTGLLTWTPTASQLGDRAFTLVLEDLAGNRREQSLSLRVTTDSPTAPTLPALADIELLAGSPRFLPLNGVAANSMGLQYEVTTDNPDLVSVSMAPTGTTLRMTVANYGEMVFRLFDDYVPSVVGAFRQLVSDGEYDGQQWHRVTSESMMIGGAASDGLGVSELDSSAVDDQYHADLQHNQPGVLSLAKLVDDGNRSHFFVTNQALRELDFHNSIVGQLISGEDVRQAMSHAVTNVGGVPRVPIMLESVEVVDSQSGLLRVAAVEGATGTANVTVVAVDELGGRTARTFEVHVQADSYNSGPFLVNPPSQVDVVAGQTVDLQLVAQDVEGDAYRFYARTLSETPYKIDLNAATGRLSVTPPVGFVGDLELRVGVYPRFVADQLDRFDSQTLVIHVSDPGASEVELDDGISDDMIRDVLLSHHDSFFVEGPFDSWA